MESGAPVDRQSRIVSLDVLRGFALLGILVMNIQSFAMPASAYMNPASFGDLQGINLRVWELGYVFFDMKFMGLFSMLFGAGVLLFLDRAESRGAPAGWLHYRRSFWLVIFGLLHAHLMWMGDILYSYGMCAFLVFLFRNRSPKSLVIWGVLFLLVAFGLMLLSGLSVPYWEEADRIDLANSWSPDAASIEKEIADFRGGFWAWLPRNSEAAFGFETFLFLFLFLWRVTGMMLLGMAFYRWGILGGERDATVYRRLLIGGGALGLVLIGIGLQQLHAHEFSFEKSFFLDSQWNYWGSVAMTMAYIGLVVGWVKSGRWPGLQRRLAAVGRMAFTNYVLHTVIAIVVMRVFGLFGSLERWQQLSMVVMIWIFQLWLSSSWLARFRFGPLEWLWRSLTYWKLQPMRRG